MKIESEYNGIEHGELCWVWDDDANHPNKCYFMGVVFGTEYPILVVSEKGDFGEYKNTKKIEPKRELKAADLIGWWATNEIITSQLVVWANVNQIAFPNCECRSLDSVGDWRFTKDPFIPLDKWLTLDEVREGLS